MCPSVLSDHSLACRLEQAEGLANAHFVDTRLGSYPSRAQGGSKWQELTQCTTARARHARNLRARPPPDANRF